MDAKTMTEKIEKARETIAKKQATMEKKQASIQKKQALLPGITDEHDAYWARCDIEELEDDVKRLAKDIAHRQEALAGYEAKLAQLQEEQAKLEALYDILGGWMDQVVEAWDAWDEEKREKRLEGKSRAYDEYMALTNDEKWHTERGQKLYNLAFYHAPSDEEIHARNVEAVRALVLDLYDRTEKVVGSVTDWKYLKVTEGNQGFAVINGRVLGTDGVAEVESIYAGGWNIQRLHIRTLVHAVRGSA